MLSHFKNNQDLYLICILLFAIVMMIIPMPLWVIDAIIAFNITLSVLILVVSVYLQTPQQFSTFPAVILISTALRLATTISTTRLILGQANAGDIINAFGTFVTGNNIIVGIVIFFIITTVQFLVITKGSERVAEVSARFSLDAMPGRQMSIDAELRNGNITAEQARKQREKLKIESQFFGSMDGALKFVKGDAIAGIIIIFVNFIGGIAIGTLQLDLSTSQAVDIYTRLTIGDGLVAQIPALLMAFCAGTVITRIDTGEKRNLGSELSFQLLGSPTTLLIVGIFVMALALIPGFPTLIFLMLGGSLCLTFLISERKRLQYEKEEKNTQKIGNDVLKDETKSDTPDALRIRINQEMYNTLSGNLLTRYRNEAIKRFEKKVGVSPPPIIIISDNTLENDVFEADYQGVAFQSYRINPNSVFAIFDPDLINENEIRGERVTERWNTDFAFWISRSEIDEETLKNAATYIAEELILELVFREIRMQPGNMLRLSGVREYLTGSKRHDDLEIMCDQVMHGFTSGALLELLRKLVDEGVPLYQKRLMLETLIELIPAAEDLPFVLSSLRVALKRQICDSVANKDRIIICNIIAPEIEQQLLEVFMSNPGDQTNEIPNPIASSILNDLRNIKIPMSIDAALPVIACSMIIRPALSNLLRNNNVPIKVIGFGEISHEFKLQPINTLGEMS